MDEEEKMLGRMLGKEIKMGIEEFAKRHGLRFGKKKNELIKAVIRKKGFCPCRKERKSENLCPCEQALKDIMRNGKCLCGLFVASDE